LHGPVVVLIGLICGVSNRLKRKKKRDEINENRPRRLRNVTVKKTTQIIRPGNGQLPQSLVA
jgi:hypothetical protein